jgi:hypothetical protein
MPCTPLSGVREALLGDAVDHQLGVGVQVRDLGGQVATDRQPRVLAESFGEGDQGAVQAKIVEDLRAQVADHRADLVAQCPRGLLNVTEGGRDARRGVASSVVEFEHQGRHALADLVVKLAREADALLLLRRQHAATAFAPLDLQALDHRVKDVGELRALGNGAVDRDPLAGPQGVDACHHASQLLEWGNRAPDQDKVHQHDRHQGDEQDHRLCQRELTADARGGEGEQANGEREHKRVRHEHVPKQRGAVAPRPSLQAIHGRLTSIVWGAANTMFRQRYMPRTRPAARLSNRDGWGALTDAHNNLGGWMQRPGYRTAG